MHLDAYKLIALSVIMLLTVTIQAADTNEQAIRIQADFMQLDIRDGSSEYRGNVLIEKGSTRLSGDSVQIRKKNGQPNRISIRGKPARYSRPDGSQPTTAQSELMLFDLDSEILTLKNGARLQQKDQLIESDFIRFDTRKQVLLAGSDKKRGSPAKQRVNIILSPGANGQP